MVGGIFSIIGIVFAWWLQNHMKDQQAALTVANAVKNSLGAMQQAATAGIQAARPSIALPPGAPPQLATGLQYALDNAGDEAKRLGITPEVLAQKITAQVGLANIATNIAVAGNATSAVPAALDPTPPSPVAPAYPGASH